jgi:Ca2+-binding RTX toxin-like protein
MFEVNALGGVDMLTVNELTGTDLTNVVARLAGTLGGAAGDAAADTIVVYGTATNDSVTVSSSTNGVVVAGLQPRITITGSEPANDRLTINLLAGDDLLDASGLIAGIIGLTVDGGIDDDVLTGSAGADTLLGGEGDDVLIGGPGLDVLDGGPGNNIIIQD